MKSFLLSLPIIVLMIEPGRILAWLAVILVALLLWAGLRWAGAKGSRALFGA